MLAARTFGWLRQRRMVSTSASVASRSIGQRYTPGSVDPRPNRTGMTSLDRLRVAFRTALDLPEDYEVDSLEYRGIDKWDSLAHMALVAEIEDAFDIMIDTDE